jgi:hypothetical protein
VRVEDQRIKPSRVAATGNGRAAQGWLVWNVMVTALSDRRGDAGCCGLYREAPESIAAGPRKSPRKAAAAATPTRLGRPTKRERRKLKAFFEEAKRRLAREPVGERA